MKKIFLLILSLFLLTGCSLKKDNLENATIYTTIYPIKYLTEFMYKDYSTIESIYPAGADVTTYELTDKQIKNYSKGDLFIYNGLSNEKTITKNLINKNRNLLIIDVSNGLSYTYGIKELWMSPNNYLMLAKNIRDYLKEYLDSKIIANSPFRLLSAGCADLISNFTAIKDWQLAHRLKNEPYSESAASLSIMSAKMITDNVDSIKPGLEESARLVVKTLFSSGMAISIAGSSRPASGSEHTFSHALDKILDKPCLHGEQCGVGTILMMYLYGGDWKFIRNSLKAVGAPTSAKELGISDENVIDALTMAHTIRPERYTILGDNGISEDAAYELALKTGVIK